MSCHDLAYECNSDIGIDGYHLIYALWKRENAKYTLLRYYTTCTTRCGFVNSVFGFAARKVSRHQLHKHVNTHVYLGVWRITLNSVQAVVGDPHDHVDKPFCVVQLSYSQIWEVQIGSCESRISCYSGSGSTYSRLHLFRVR